MKIRGLLKLYRVFRELGIDLDEGVMRSKYGGRYLLFSDYMILAVGDDLRRVFGEEQAADLTYRIGFEAGIRFAVPIKERFEGEEPFRLVRRSLDFAQTAGWGKHKANISLEEGRGTVVVYNSPLPVLSRGGKKPVCHFHCGLLAGSATAVLGKRVTAKEVNCVAKGDDFCKFTLTIKENVEE